jgi:hypothetical protein
MYSLGSTRKSPKCVVYILADPARPALTPCVNGPGMPSGLTPGRNRHSEVAVPSACHHGGRRRRLTVAHGHSGHLDLSRLLYRRGPHKWKDGVTRADRWGHDGATSGPRPTRSQRTTPVNTGTTICRGHRVGSPSAAGHPDRPRVPDTEAVEGSEPPGGTASAVAGHDTAAAVNPAGNHTRFVPNAYDRFGVLQRGACLQREKRPHRRLEGRGR